METILFASFLDHLCPIDPYVKRVLLKNDPEHGAVDGQDPSLHDFVLVLNELLVRFPSHLKEMH